MNDEIRSVSASQEGLHLRTSIPEDSPAVTLEILLDHFTQEVRRGIATSVDLYAARYPEFADEIWELFPLVDNLERCKVVQDAAYVRQNFPDEFPLRQLGEYTIVREIGRGGMGIVFEATHSPAGRPVAIKLLPGRDQGDRRQSRDRFHREAITIAQFRHQNIVPVYSFGEHDGYYFYVMQLVRGVGLDWVIQKLRESPAPVMCSTIRDLKNRQSATSEAMESTLETPSVRCISRNSWKVFAKIGIQVATALSYAHQRNVLHHDIKPANLLLNAAGKVVVTDFGGFYQSRTGHAKAPECTTGTLRYMAPERLKGDSDARSDVYSLGATLYELVTRTPLFEAADRSRLTDLILNSNVTRPVQFAPDLPRAFEAIILTALAGNRNQRYPSAKALADDLLRFVNQQPVHAILSEENI
ncbi:MAG: stkP 6 [Planctomycetaceae bacterium]|nr:stkP 6 [Planctomycetaceae bacterium]